MLKDSKFADARYLRQMLLEVFTALDKAQRKFGFHRALALAVALGFAPSLLLSSVLAPIVAAHHFVCIMILTCWRHLWRLLMNVSVCHCARLRLEV